MIGRTLSHYRVIKRLGAGGMGEVYLAEDTRLGRQVALKFLPRDLTCDESAKARFVREARAASALDHPHICTVYDVEELPDGQLLLAMAYCDGETMKARLARGAMPVEEAVDVACQVAEALAEAHARGIVHRDVKPSNVMLSKSGRVKLVDFGLARVADTAGLTTSGATVGTPAYMSPEQARGEEVDGRTDLWSLGATLYEAVAGQPPFPGRSADAVLYAVLNKVPEPVERLRKGLPQALVRIINRLLAKDRVARYQQAEQLVADLDACRQYLQTSGGRAQSEARVPSIAVLVFFDMSPERDQGYFCEGLAEELINAISRLEGVRVPSLTSALQFKGQAADIRKIGEQLNVETVLEGSVRKSGDRLRITAQLVNVSDGYHLWSERYDRRLDDVFEVQDEIARAIVGQLRVRLKRPGGEPLIKPATENMEAYQLCLKGRYYFNRRYKGMLEKAIDCFKSSIEKAPSYAAAYAGLADCYSAGSVYALGSYQQMLSLAREAAERAVALDPSLPEAHHSLGEMRFFLDWDLADMERSFQRALELNPNMGRTCLMYAWALATSGQWDQVSIRVERGLTLDPISPMGCFVAAVVYYITRQYDRGLETVDRTLEIDPHFPLALWIRTFLLVAVARHAEAVDAAERSLAMAGHVPLFQATVPYALAGAGRTEEARRHLDQLVQLLRRAYVPEILFATVHAALGDEAATLTTLERAADQGCAALHAFLSTVVFDFVRHHPRFARVAEKIRCPELVHLPPEPARRSDSKSATAI